MKSLRVVHPQVTPEQVRAGLAVAVAAPAKLSAGLFRSQKAATQLLSAPAVSTQHRLAAQTAGLLPRLACRRRAEAVVAVAEVVHWQLAVMAVQVEAPVD